MIGRKLYDAGNLDQHVFNLTMPPKKVIIRTTFYATEMILQLVVGEVYELFGYDAVAITLDRIKVGSLKKDAAK